MCLDRAPEGPAGRGVSVASLESSIASIPVEDVMVLYVDGVGGLRTEFYVGGSGGRSRPIQRRGYPQAWLVDPSVRQRLRGQFDQRVNRLAAAGRWQTLHWLYHGFPDRQLCAGGTQRGWDTAGAVAAVDELMRIVRRVAANTQVGTHTGWDEITALDDQPAIRAAAVRMVGDGLRSGTDGHLLRMCYPTGLATALGGLGSSASEVYDLQWASLVVDYLRVINNLRKGAEAESNVGYSDGTTAVFGGRAVVVGGARSLWLSLPPEQQALIADDDQWRQVVDGVWPVVRSRIDWGLMEGGSDFTSSALGGGRFREPIGQRGLL